MTVPKAPRVRRWFFVLPWIGALLLLYAAPAALLAILSVGRWRESSPAAIEWVGLSNFHRLLTDARLGQALANSAIYSVVNVPLQLAAALLLALLIRGSTRVGAWAVFYYAPHTMAGVAALLTWWWLLNPQSGPINEILRPVLQDVHRVAFAAGFAAEAPWTPPNWLYAPNWAKPSLWLMNLWYCGGGMLILLAALLKADPALSEAARLDGAGRVRRFLHVTLPHVSPAILFNAVTGAMLSMQEFSAPFLLSNFQQQDALSFYSLYLYRTAFERGDFGYAAAQAWLLLAMLLAFGLATSAITRRWVHYDMEAEE